MEGIRLIKQALPDVRTSWAFQMFPSGYRQARAKS